MFKVSKKSVQRVVSGLKPDISSFENLKIAKLNKKWDRYEFICPIGWQDVRFYTYYQGLLKKNTIISVSGKFNQVKFWFWDYEFYVDKIVINLTDSFKNLYALKSEFEPIYNYLSEKNVSFDKLKEMISSISDETEKIKKMDKLSEFEKVFEAQTTYDKLSLIWIEDRMANWLYFKYKDDAVDILKANPYVLVKDFWLDMKSCDQIAKKIWSFEQMDQRRVSWILYEIFRLAKKNWNSYLNISEIKLALNSFLDNKRDIQTFMRELDFLSSIGDFINQWELYFLSEIYEIEEVIAKTLIQRSKPVLFDDIDAIEKIISNKIDEFEKKNKFSLNDSQKSAIKSAIKNQVYVITWGPGTWKTTIQAVIYSILSEIYGESNITMVAPTGIAAKNLSKKVWAEAKTIHSTIKMNPFGFKNPLIWEAEDKLETKVLIIDEMSMVSTDIFLQILKSIKRTTQIIVVWDGDQLYSIEYGQVLSDILDSKKLPYTSLNEWFRFWWSVLTNASKIRNWDTDLVFDKDFMFAEIDWWDEELDYFNTKIDYENGFVDKAHLSDMKYVLDKKYSIEYESRLKKAFQRALDQNIDKEKIKVLTPFNKQFFGTDISNKIIGWLFSNNTWISLDKYAKTFKVWDVVVNTLNNKDLWIMNGDNWIIIDVYEDYTGKRKMDVLEIDFWWEKILVKWANIKNITHSYALTIHKSQGSWFPVIIIPLFDNQIEFFNRKLLYTAITRAQTKVIFLWKKSLLAKVIANNDKRNSNLTSNLLKLK